MQLKEALIKLILQVQWKITNNNKAVQILLTFHSIVTSLSKNKQLKEGSSTCIYIIIQGFAPLFTQLQILILYSNTDFY